MHENKMGATAIKSFALLVVLGAAYQTIVAFAELQLIRATAGMNTGLQVWSTSINVIVP